ncbi:MAG: hypothetical protein INQ03_10965 [Candidatus Heimdallarchaeota archaeon]|nr:hypothetical protein [Candidatus Heimdallarchaeota archaeon]
MMKILKFQSTVGSNRNEFPIEVMATVKFQKIVGEVGKKLNLPNESITIHPPGGAALTFTDYNKTVEEIIEAYGDRFRIINRGVVG